jgi:flavin-binding protein dodecin
MHDGRRGPSRLREATSYSRVMTDRTYRITEIVGTSTEGVSEAIDNGIKRAGKTLRHLDWFEVEGIRGQITDTQVSHYQVTMKLGFRLEDDE